MIIYRYSFKFFVLNALIKYCNKMKIIYLQKIINLKVYYKIISVNTNLVSIKTKFKLTHNI